MQILCELKTNISIGWPWATELNYKCLKLIGHLKSVSANLKEMIEKLIRVYAHLAENRMDNYAGLVWDPVIKENFMREIK